jgi:hypothetical protein
MKKRIVTVIAAALALLTLTAASAATAGDLFFVSGSGVVVRQDDGYMITGTLRDADSHVIGTLHGTLVELTTGFNTCPDFRFQCFFGGNTPTCNLLGGQVTLKFQAQYDAEVSNTIDGRVGSSLCKNPDDPSTYQLRLFLYSTSHVPPGAFPDVFYVFATVEQISPTVFKWS